MSTYLVGDLHGCYDEFKLLLSKIKFNDKYDHLLITGDIVARGPKSLELLIFLYSLREKIKLVLGNHDLHLISSFYGIKNNKNLNYIKLLLNYNKSYKIIRWLRKQPLLYIDHEKKIFMSHAGITPQWNIKIAQKCSNEFQKILSSSKFMWLLKLLYNESSILPTNWNLCLNLSDRLKFSVNVFTRMRFCYLNKELCNIYPKNFKNKFLSNIKPWFYFTHDIPSKINIIFGHWSSVSEYYKLPNHFFALDTGCCWGKHLTILRWEDKKIFTQTSLKS